MRMKEPPDKISFCWGGTPNHGLSLEACSKRPFLHVCRITIEVEDNNHIDLKAFYNVRNDELDEIIDFLIKLLSSVWV